MDEAFPFHAAGEHKTGQCSAGNTDEDAGSGSRLVGQWITDLPQDPTADGDDDFSTAIVRNRNAPNEMTRDAVIKMSMTCSTMCGLRKKMTATAPHSQTLNCAKADSLASSNMSPTTAFNSVFNIPSPTPHKAPMSSGAAVPSTPSLGCKKEATRIGLQPGQ